MAIKTVYNRDGSIYGELDTDKYLFNNTLIGSEPVKLDVELYPYVKIAGVYYKNDGEEWFTKSRANDSAGIISKSGAFKYKNTSPLKEVNLAFVKSLPSELISYMNYNGTRRAQLYVTDYRVNNEYMSSIAFIENADSVIDTPYRGGTKQPLLNNSNGKITDRYFWDFTPEHAVSLYNNYTDYVLSDIYVTCDGDYVYIKDGDGGIKNKIPFTDYLYIAIKTAGTPTVTNSLEGAGATSWTVSNVDFGRLKKTHWFIGNLKTNSRHCFALFSDPDTTKSTIKAAWSSLIKFIKIKIYKDMMLKINSQRIGTYKWSEITPSSSSDLQSNYTTTTYSQTLSIKNYYQGTSQKVGYYLSKGDLGTWWTAIGDWKSKVNDSVFYSWIFYGAPEQNAQFHGWKIECTINDLSMSGTYAGSSVNATYQSLTSNTTTFGLLTTIRAPFGSFPQTIPLLSNKYPDTFPGGIWPSVTTTSFPISSSTYYYNIPCISVDGVKIVFATYAENDIGIEILYHPDKSLLSVYEESVDYTFSDDRRGNWTYTFHNKSSYMKKIENLVITTSNHVFNKGTYVMSPFSKIDIVVQVDDWENDYTVSVKYNTVVV